MVLIVTELVDLSWHLSGRITHSVSGLFIRIFSGRS